MNERDEDGTTAATSAKSAATTVKHSNVPSSPPHARSDPVEPVGYASPGSASGAPAATMPRDDAVRSEICKADASADAAGNDSDDSYAGFFFDGAGAGGSNAAVERPNAVDDFISQLNGKCSDDKCSDRLNGECSDRLNGECSDRLNGECSDRLNGECSDRLNGECSDGGGVGDSAVHPTDARNAPQRGDDEGGSECFARPSASPHPQQAPEFGETDEGQVLEVARDGGGEVGVEEDGLEENFNFNDADIQRDAANDCVAFLVHIALAFFAFLFVCAVAGCIILVSQYGFLTFLVLLMLVSIVLGSGYFIGGTILDDKKLKPVRRKMNRWRAIAKAVVVREIRNFQTEMNEHLLLMDGEAENEEEYENNDSVQDGPEVVVQEDGAATTKEGRKKNKGGRQRSVLFGLIKPFLKPKVSRKRSFFRKKKDKGKNASMVPTEGYVPPAADASMA